MMTKNVAANYKEQSTKIVVFQLKKHILIASNIKIS